MSTTTLETTDAVKRDAYEKLKTRIQTRQARFGVIGLGYVGLPLGLTLNAAGFDVTGIDIDSNRVEAITAARSYITDVTGDELLKVVTSRKFRATTDLSAIRELDAISICVPTPLRKTKDPDMSYVVAAADSIARNLRPGQLVILESTTYPGTTEELILPTLEAGGLKAGEDFFLAYSPERVDPGNKNYSTKDIPKVVGGITPRCSELAAMLYGASMNAVVRVSSTRVAEMVKLLENTFRSVNIALVNEIALMCSHMKLDVWEVIKAASSKPFGFMPFYPGPGLGGHCIPIDPLYLEWKSKIDGFESRFIGLADKINSGMPRFVATRAMELMNERGKAVRGSRIHVLGVTYKKDISDSRESPALEVIKLLLGLGANITYSDPFVPALNVEAHRLESLTPSPERLSACDLAIITTDHSGFDYPGIVRYAPLVFDTRNATAGLTAKNLVRL
ncbi:MAG: nucleotide sugar dehydrogenase [Acidobacteria bacterium]|nr:nucleotide sugar dehydrogenase [Acidobacteriota bacterium]